MPLKTPLYSLHVAAQAKMVDFAGWDMPLHYGSQIEEHHQVRQHAGMFDVSHMTVVDLKGKDCGAFLSRLLANDIAKLKQPGKALYSCMLNDKGGVIDDLIVYYLRDGDYRMVVNAATRTKDLAWINQHAKNYQLTVTERDDLAMIAVQGPQAREKLCQVVAPEYRAIMDLKPFYAFFEQSLFIARTGYTGEDGFEVILNAQQAVKLWQDLGTAGVKPIGLGARDSLRLEAGMNLYGQDMDETTTPWESALAWTIALDNPTRDFIGRAALEAAKSTNRRQLVGLLLSDRGILRHGQKVICDNGEGEICSGGFSPTLQQSIGFARIPLDAAADCQVEIRNKQLRARVVKPPFVRNGQACFKNA